MTDMLAGAPYPRVSLTVLAATTDEALAHEVEAECEARGYRLTRAHGTDEIGQAVISTRPDVVLLDLEGTLDAAARMASSLTSLHADLRVVLVGESPFRTLDGFRIVDRWRAGDRILDQLELAYIGIPVSIREPEPSTGPRVSDEPT
jgi:hypothetical protein